MCLVYPGQVYLYRQATALYRKLAASPDGVVGNEAMRWCRSDTEIWVRPGSNSPASRSWVPQENGAEKGEKFMSYLYVKWNSFGLRFARRSFRH